MGIGIRRGTSSRSISRSTGGFRSGSTSRSTTPRPTQSSRTTYTRGTSSPSTNNTVRPANTPKQGINRTVTPATTTAPTTNPTTTAPATNPTTTAATAPRTRAPQTTAAPVAQTPTTAATAPAATPTTPGTTTAPATDWQNRLSQGFGLLKDGLKGGLQDKFGANPTTEERAAMQFVRDMLEPTKLGGGDRTFNYGDRQAIINGLMRDRAGLKQEVANQLRAEGKDLQIGPAMRAIDGKRGLLANIARKKINEEVPGRINQQLNQGLRDAHIDPNTARQVDNHPRNLSFQDMRQFEQNAQMLQAMQQRVAEKLGMDITFPNGISQEAIDFTLQGKFGLPPGAVLTPRKK